ncbi:hypothetical protein WMO79_04595 [Micrococcaceae bacterium Sec7.4]
MTETEPKTRRLTDEEGSRIKAAAVRLAWNNVWYYEANGSTVFVLEAGPGRTLSMWHIHQLIESIGEILGPDRAFLIEGIEALDPDTWTKMTPL